MKTYLLIIVLLTSISCQSDMPKENKMENELTLKLKITESGAVGFADIYACEVLEVINGDFKNEKISLTIIDRSELGALKLESLPVIEEITFEKGEENEPYQTMPINGFVDDNKTSWLIKPKKNTTE